MNFTVTENLALAGCAVGSYAAIIATFIIFGKHFKRRLHDFTVECILERQRQNESLERLFSLAYDY